MCANEKTTNKRIKLRQQKTEPIPRAAGHKNKFSLPALVSVCANTVNGVRAANDHEGIVSGNVVPLLHSLLLRVFLCVDIHPV